MEDNGNRCPAFEYVLCPAQENNFGFCLITEMHCDETKHKDCEVWRFTQEEFALKSNVFQLIKRRYEISGDEIHRLVKERIRENLAERTMREAGWSNERTKVDFWATDFGECDRKICYKFLGIKVGPVSTRGRRIFDTGNAMHERYVTYLTRCQMVEDVELSCRKGNFSCRLDMVIRDLKTGERLVLELKSINTYGYKRLLKVMEPQHKHKLQLLINCRLSGIRRGIVLYEDKNNQAILEFIVDSESEESKKLYKEIDASAEKILAEVVKFPKTKVLDIPKGHVERYCKNYCSYWAVCYGREDAVIPPGHLKKLKEKLRRMKAEMDAPKK